MKKIFILFNLLFFISYFSFSQNVGIGITMPIHGKLEVYGAAGYTAAIFGGESTGIGIIRNNPAIGFNVYYSNDHKYIADGYSSKIWFDAINGALFFDVFGYGNANTSPVTGANSMVINNTGNVSIRTYQTANASIYAVKAGNFDGSAIFSGTTYSSYFDYSGSEDTYIRGGKSGSKVFINDISAGKIILGGGASQVGINNGIPVYPLEVRQIGPKGILLVEPSNSFNNWEMRAWTNGGGNSDLNLLYNGIYKGYFAVDTGDYYTYSDGRLKKNIMLLPSLLDKVIQLRPVEYEMKYNNSAHQKTIGFIAQEVKKLFPELVTVVTNTSRGYPGISDLHTIDYNGFGILAIKAIQEQQELIKKMETQNTVLKKRIEAAEKIIAEKK